MLRFLKPLLLSIVALLIVTSGGGALYLYFYPISVPNPKMWLNVAIGSSTASPTTAIIKQRLQVPAGFTISIYASDLPMARMLRFTAAGDLLVSRPRAGEIDLLEHGRDNSHQISGRRVLLSGLNRPHGIDIADGWLYVGETDAIGRVQFDEQSGQLRGEYRHIVSGLTGNGNHWSKTIRIGPDGFLYLAQGSTCNVCEETDKRRATIMRFRNDGSGGEIYATGLRNSVGLDWSPWDQQLYATDNGRDMLGDDFPPCELNRIQRDGFYGWPYINGFGVLDPDFGKDKEALLKTAISPAFGFRAHNAPLGIHFLRHAKMPAGYERTALVALHGSWNRSTLDGYKVVALHWHENGTIEQTDFLSGFERDGNIIGRPVDIAEGPDGAIYISDDYAGTIYRIAYGEALPSIDVPSAVGGAAKIDTPKINEELQALNPQERAQLAAQGEKLFAQYPCKGCHAPRATDDLHRVHELKNLSARYSLAQLQAFFIAPTPPMPVFPLSENERRALAVYLLTRAP